VPIVERVADAEARELTRLEAGVAHAQHEVPVAVAAERAVERAEPVVERARVRDAAREHGVVAPQRLRRRLVVEDLARAAVADDPAAAEPEPGARLGLVAEQREVARVVPPVVVVEPADDLPASALQAGGAGVDLARTGAPERGDPRIPERLGHL